jgi:radical SAM superfamily enzyme with C-terminal helix-hairpin-helix motif
MSRNRIIIDCYTDEPAGLGVPPFLGVWARYAAGGYRDLPTYLTIDDLRLVKSKKQFNKRDFDPPTGKTRIDLINHTRTQQEVRQILKSADQAIIIAGVQTPGKYLSARPGTLSEIKKLLSGYNFTRVLTGPAAICGTQLRGGAAPETGDTESFNQVRKTGFEDYAHLQPEALKGAEILKQIPQKRVIEIEAGRGCRRETGCSFCTEPLKGEPEWREADDIIAEVKKFRQLGAEWFRLGKQACIFSYQNGDIEKLRKLLQGISRTRPKVFHIDNADPKMVTPQRAELMAEYLTPGSAAAMGAESFDEDVISVNNLNSQPEEVYKAAKTLTDIGGGRGKNGCPKILAGINILLGLEGETKQTLAKNFDFLKKMLDDGLLIRRINIRQVVSFKGTRLHERVGNKVLRKNRKYYGRWTEKVRNEIDLPMLERIFPEGTVMRGLISETHQGQVTFLRQPGSYPIVVGVRDRLPLGETYDVKITDHMLRSLTGEVM